MRSKLEEILVLQKIWPDEEAMKRRGELVQGELSSLLNSKILDVHAAHRVLADINAEGSNGKGKKAKIPWCRVYSLTRSPAATQGWYVVYLFSADGERAYLSLNQGTHRRKNGRFDKRTAEELRPRVKWAREVLQLEERLDLDLDISLEVLNRDLGRQYEHGNVVSFTYTAGSVPDEAVLTGHFVEMVSWLARLYEAAETRWDVPGEPAPEIADAHTAIERAVSPQRKSGQGFQLNTDEKLAIERHAVKIVTSYYKSLGFNVKYVGASEPFDLEIKRHGEKGKVSVEVKGTVSSGAEVFLTHGEVKHHRAEYPHNALAIVHSINLDRSSHMPKATGGKLYVRTPWKIEEGCLTPQAFKYTTGL